MRWLPCNSIAKNRATYQTQMGSDPNLSTNTIGFCLLPSELIQNILLYLALPEIVHLKSLTRSVAHIISDRDFVRAYNLQARSTTWLFVYKKKWRRDAVLHGFTDRSNRWFKIEIADLLKGVIYPSEDIYFLTASGNFLLFVSNTRQEVIAVNLVTKTVKWIPPSPLGPRDTSSWRRSGMKLVSWSDHFRFLFSEFVGNRPVLFVYNSETDKWQSTDAREHSGQLPRVSQQQCDYIYLNVINRPQESMVMITGSENDEPVVVRPIFDARQSVRRQQQLIGGLNDTTDRLYVHGDGYILIVKSRGMADVNIGARMLDQIELWGLSSNGRHWEYISRVASEIMGQIKKPFRVMMGCLEGKEGIIKGVLLSNFEGLWDIIWVSYDIGRGYWTWVPLPDSKMKGLNMAGIAFSSGLTLS